MQSDERHTPSGAPLYVHRARREEPAPAGHDETLLGAVKAHIERHLGKVETVFHETASKKVHLDVLVVPPSGERAHLTLVTCGMAARPMHIPESADVPAYVELVLSLPPDWPLDRTPNMVEPGLWPILWLKYVARLPHLHDTWIGRGHTVPNGDPPEPIAPDTPFCGVVVLSPVLTPPGFATLDVSDGRTVEFLALYPLYPEEIALKLERGARELATRMDQAGVTELVHPGRANLAI